MSFVKRNYLAFKSKMNASKQLLKSKPSTSYRCKLNGEKTKITLNDLGIALANKNKEATIYYPGIKSIKLQTKWWRIRVKVTTATEKLGFDFPSYRKACRMYEALTYKKIAQQ